MAREQRPPGRAGAARDGAVGHEQLAHPADLLLHFWAPSEEALLAEAGRGLVELLTAGAAVEPRDSRQLSLDSLDPEDRLVRWLNELLVLATLDGFVVAEAEVRLREGGLDARLLGEADARGLVRTELKSVTYHGVVLRRLAGRLEGQVLIDV